MKMIEIPRAEKYSWSNLGPFVLYEMRLIVELSLTAISVRYRVSADHYYIRARSGVPFIPCNGGIRPTVIDKS